MATLIKTDGSKLEIQPQNGLDFQLDELQKFVDGYIDIINLHNGDILVINDNGKDVLDSNETQCYFWLGLYLWRCRYV